MQYYRPPASSRRERVSRRSSGLMKYVILNKLLRFAFFGLIGLIIVGFFSLLWISRELPTPGKLASSDISESTKILDKNGEILYSIKENRSHY
mgnify:CR=1 FL=1